MKKNEYLDLLKKDFIKNGIKIKELKQKTKELNRLLNSYSIFDSKRKQILNDLSKESSSLAELKKLTAIQNIIYFIIKKSETIEAEKMRSKFFRDIFIYITHQKNIKTSGPFLIFDDCKIAFKPASEIIDKTITSGFNCMSSLIEKIEKYGRHYAEELKIKHPFNKKYAGFISDFSSRCEGWIFEITEKNIIIRWAEEEGSCGHYDWEEKSLIIPLIHFSEYSEFKDEEIEKKIAIKENIREQEKNLKQLQQSIYHLSCKIRDGKNKEAALRSDFKKIYGIEFNMPELESDFKAQLKEKEQELSTEKDKEKLILAYLQELRTQLNKGF